MDDKVDKRRGVPLVRVDGYPYDTGEHLTPERMATDPCLRPEFKTKRSIAAEKILELGDCLYFYVGHACPRFGDMVFVYDPAMSAGWRGNVTPFDTGGIIGYIGAKGLPGKALDIKKRDNPSENLTEPEKETFHEYVHRAGHRVPLNEWQNRFQAFLAQHYDSPRDYVRERTPGCQCRPAGDDGTGRHLDPSNDRPAWTWELQVHHDHKILDGLWLLCLAPDRYAELRAVIAGLPDSSDQRPPWQAMLENKDVIPEPSDKYVTEEAERRIAEWL